MTRALLALLLVAMPILSAGQSGARVVKHDVNYELLRPRVTSVENSTTGKVTVVGWETVEVPAGKFRALKVELESTVQPADGSRAFPRQATFWYVPDVRRWVKYQMATPKVRANEELLAYKLNED